MVALYDPSPAALAPLMDTFWSPKGWRKPVAWPEPEIMSRAVEAGVMFDRPLSRDHDGWVKAVRDAVRPLSATEVAGAFLASLTSHRLDLRSALGSYAVARYLPEHDRAPLDRSGMCRVCGLYAETTIDPNVLSFERFKWGGVRKDKLGYVAFDLAQFARAPRLQPTQADTGTWQQVIDQLRDLPAGTSAARTAPYLKMIPGNKGERNTVLDTFGICGILGTDTYPGYENGFIPWIDRASRPQRYAFGHYPVGWWHAEDGISTSALREFLPQLR